MISKGHRFTRRDFIFLRPRMKKFVVGDFLFFYCPLQKVSKMAAVISKKVNKRAVARNNWRRKVYALVGKVLIKSERPLALICLYKGASIPENTDTLVFAWQQFKAYAENNKLLKFTE